MGDRALAASRAATFRAGYGGVLAAAWEHARVATRTESSRTPVRLRFPPRLICPANVASVMHRPSSARLHPCVWAVETPRLGVCSCPSGGEPRGWRTVHRTIGVPLTWDPTISARRRARPEPIRSACALSLLFSRVAGAGTSADRDLAHVDGDHRLIRPEFLGVGPAGGRDDDAAHVAVAGGQEL